MFRRWGCSPITTKCSAMVRDGQMTRQQASERAAKDEQKDQPEIFPEFLDALKITEREFNEALKKDFRAFPNISNRNRKLILLSKKIFNIINRF